MKRDLGAQAQGHRYPLPVSALSEQRGRRGQGPQDRGTRPAPSGASGQPPWVAALTVSGLQTVGQPQGQVAFGLEL